jgi:hypothetical protein
VLEKRVVLRHESQDATRCERRDKLRTNRVGAPTGGRRRRNDASAAGFDHPGARRR